MADDRDSAREIVYVLEKFPSETASFIYNEIRVLQERGIKTKIFSLVPGDVCPDDARDIAARTETLGPVSGLQLLQAAGYFLVRRPLALLRLLLTLPFDAEEGRFGKAIRIVHQVLVGARLAMTLRGCASHIHAHFAFKAATAALVAAELNRTTFSFTSHGSDTVIAGKRYCLRQKVRRARMVIAVSDYNKAVLGSLCPNVDSSRIVVNRTGVLLEQFPIRVDRPHDDGMLRIVCVANLYPVKNHEGLIRGCALLARKGVRFRLEMAGRDVAGLLPGLRTLADREGIANQVVFLGVVDHMRISELLECADVCILASHSEGIPVALMEAMARGVPVIGPRVTGVPELVQHEVTGLLVDPLDPESIAAALARIVVDPQLAERLRLAARSHVESTYDMRRNANRLADLYCQLILDAK
jgi:glycosyltransferase involved in cell wall biosynthesis